MVAAAGTGFRNGSWHMFDVGYGTEDRDRVYRWPGGRELRVPRRSDGHDAGDGFSISDADNQGVNDSVAEVAVYPTALTPGQVADHAAVADFAGPLGGPLAAAEMRGGGGFCLSCSDEIDYPLDFWRPGGLRGREHVPHLQRPADPEPGARRSRSPAPITRIAASSDNGPLGFGWVDNLGARLGVSGSTAMLTEENGAQTTFTLTSGAWAPPPRDIATLTHNLGSDMDGRAPGAADAYV